MMVRQVASTSRRLAVAMPAVLALTASLETTPAAAQSQSAQVSLEEIVVTARRREESLTDVPMAISALTAADFEKRDIVDLSQVAALTPSLTLTSYSAQRARRDSPILLVRNVSRGGTGVFVNGAPAGNGQAAYLGDLERVEVLKGPQAAYFGRSTFAGAINYVPRRPAEEWGGSVDAQRGSYGLGDYRISVEGPIAADVLSMRVSYRGYSQNGQYDSASDGSAITNEKSDSFSAIFDLHPSENFNARAVFLYNKNADGYPTFAKLNSAFFNCNAGAAPAGTNNYICGKLPKVPANRIGADFVITPTVVNVFYNNSRNLPNIDRLKVLSRDPTRSDISESYHLNFTTDYTFDNGFTASYLGAYNRRDAQFLTNSFAEPLQTVVNPFFAGTSGAPTIAGVLPFPTFYIFSLSRADDMDHEVRVASDQEARLRGMLGVSYFRNFPYVGALWGFLSNAPGANFGGNNTTTTKTWGVFGNVIYDVTEDLTVSFEARYQWDKIDLTQEAPTVALLQRAKDQSLMPRVSIQYDVNDSMNIYASYAKGVQPKGFNAVLFPEPQSTVDLVLQQTGAGRTFDGESIDMFELGLKGTTFDGRLAFNSALYYGKWKDQVITQRVVVPLRTNPALTNILTLSTNGGQSELYGLEVDASAQVTEQLALTAALGVNKSNIEKYVCVICQLNLTGNSNVTGNTLPGSPQLTGNLFAEYRDVLTGAWNWYLNGQFVYAGKMYTDETNLAWSRDRATFDFRLGVERDALTLETYVINAFDSYYTPSATRDVDIFAQSSIPPRPPVAAAFNNAFMFGLGERRQFGVRARYKF
ncbi:MAG: TonB-dependent receptor [Rhodospirillaceae bacterium]|nr:TonB-dependent receptor [Rhodospirillaceae bacterium]